MQPSEHDDGDTSPGRWKRVSSAYYGSYYRGQDSLSSRIQLLALTWISIGTESERARETALECTGVRVVPTLLELRSMRLARIRSPKGLCCTFVTSIDGVRFENFAR